MEQGIAQEKHLLRPYQKQDVARIQAARKRKRSIIFSAWMGTGKTHMYMALVLQAIKESRRVLILTHMRTLLEQTHQRLLDAGLSPGQVSVVRGKDVRFKLSAPVQLASAQTMLRRNEDALGRIDEIYLDEGHHYIAKNGWGKILNRYPKASILAPTATPARGDGRPLVGTFELMVESVLPVDRAVSDGWLAAPEIWTREGWSPDVTDIKKLKGDFEQSALGKRMASINICGRLVEHWQEKADGRPTIGFAVNTALAEQYAKRFRKAKIPSEVVLGDTPERQRQAIFERLANGITKVVWTCNVIGEGWDAPYVRCIIDATPTMSIVRNLQRWGRVMRPGKVVPIILDHAGNWIRFGFPHTPREWELPRPAKDEDVVAENDQWILPRGPKKKLLPSVRVDATGRVVAMTGQETATRVKTAIEKVRKKTKTKLVDAEIEALIEKQARRWSSTIVGALVDENELERLVLAIEQTKCQYKKQDGAICAAPTTRGPDRRGMYCIEHKNGRKDLLPCAQCGEPATQYSSQNARGKSSRKAYCAKHHGGKSPLPSGTVPRLVEGGQTFLSVTQGPAPRPAVHLLPCGVCGKPTSRINSNAARRRGGKTYCDKHKGTRSLRGPQKLRFPCLICRQPSTGNSSARVRSGRNRNAYCAKHGPRARKEQS